MKVHPKLTPIDELEPVNEEQAVTELKKQYKTAEKLLNDESKLEKFLQRLEKKLKTIPVAGTALSYVPVLISLVRRFIKKEYTVIPLGSIIAIVAALAYVVSPLDLIPDWIPVGGMLDDLAILTACLKLVQSDLDEYLT